MLKNGATSRQIGRSQEASDRLRGTLSVPREWSMRLWDMCFAVGGIVAAGGIAAGPLLANALTSPGQIQGLPVGSLSPLTVVAVYGLADPTILCTTAATTGAAQEQGVGQGPPTTAGDAQSTPQTPASAADGCVLPVVDQAAVPATPPATSEIAPLLALGPLLAAAGVAGTAAAIASGDDGSGGIPDSPQ
jgi:hypothetical protein